MERVETLIKKLQEQLEKQAPLAQMLLTAQMLQAELSLLGDGAAGDIAVSVLAPQALVTPVVEATELQEEMVAEKVTEPEEKIVEVLQVDEAEIAAELEQIKKHAEEVQKISVLNKPAITFDDEEPEIPTLAHQNKNGAAKEINESVGSTASLNDKLKQGVIELGETLTEVPVRDLKKAIGVNDKFLFIKDLFRNDEAMYERSIKTINNFSMLAEAEYWIQRELKVKLGWDDRSETVQLFSQLVKRRFS